MPNPQKHPKKRQEKEILFAAVLLITVLFEIFLTTVLLVRSAPDPVLPPPSTPTDTQPEETPVEEEIKSPLFSDATASLLDDARVSSKYALLLNADTWEVVAEKNASERFSPASMTKVMTLLVALEELSFLFINYFFLFVVARTCRRRGNGIFCHTFP